MRIEDIINRAWDKGMNAEAEDVIKLGWSVGARIARRKGWLHEVEDVKQDGALGAYLAWRVKPEASVKFIWHAAKNYIYARRSRIFRKDGRLGVALTELCDPWARCEAAMDVERLVADLTEKMLVTLTADEWVLGARHSDAHYKNKSRAMERMRCKALAT